MSTRGTPFTFMRFIIHYRNYNYLFKESIKENQSIQIVFFSLAVYVTKAFQQGTIGKHCVGQKFP